LLPLFRSRSQAELLTETFLHPDHEYSIAELARSRDIATATVHREVRELLQAGLLTEHRVGNVRRITANNESPYYQSLRQLIERAFGPEVRLSEALSSLVQVRGAWLFGSYAQRLSGQAGEAPHDVDVAVVVDGDAQAVYQATARVGAALGLEVNATVFTSDEWENTDDVFVRQIRDGILINLLVQRDEPTEEDAQ
jgi:predicted nucleotidyltransferase